ncbi:hypothetical protein D0T49_00275 [Paludibacter sp. 221]|nr:hypothetical protein [Paludibacter sp. 221]
MGRELVHVRTVSDALAMAAGDRDKYPSLAVLRRDYGAEKVEAVIKLHIIDLCENVNLKRPLRDSQVDNIAREVVATYCNLTIADVQVVFRRAKNGELGEFYESLDMPKIMSWFRTYFNERCELAADMSQNSRVWDKGDNVTPERARQQLDKLEKQLKRANK